MAKVRPFRALRYDFSKAGAPESVCCPPYDIISEQEQEAYYSENAHNVIRLELPREPMKYDAAAQTLEGWRKSRILRRDLEDCLYIYEEEFTVQGQRKKINGIIAQVQLEEFSKGIILPHEETLSKAKSDRFNLMSKTFCNFSQIYSLYHDQDKSIKPLLAGIVSGKPEVEFRAKDGIVHRLWTVPAGKITQKICESFDKLKLYIADGHHRYETALNFRDAMRNEKRKLKLNTQDDESLGYTMMMLVEMEHDGLVVFPTHRLVKDLPDFDPSAIPSEANTLFDVAYFDDLSTLEQNLGSRENTAAFYCGSEGYFLFTLKDTESVKNVLPEMSAAYCSLDVTLLHTLILEPILGIDKENMAAQKNLTYTRDIREAIQGVREGRFQCAFLLNPTRVSQIRDVSLAGEKMPQKSTYFYPKLITGLVMNQIMEKPAEDEE